MSSPPPDNRSSRVPASRECEGSVGRQGSSATAGEPRPHPAAAPPTSPASGEVKGPRKVSVKRLPPPGGFAADLPSEWGGEAPPREMFGEAVTPTRRLCPRPPRQ